MPHLTSFAGGFAGPLASSRAYTYVTASGGTETTYGLYKIHTFTTSGSFTIITSGSEIDIFMVGGGGAGGTFIGSGGGAGGVLVGTAENSPAGAYTINVGAGAPISADGTNGSNTTIVLSGTTVYNARGGGGGWVYTETNGVNPGSPGGSGGGGAGNRGGTSAGGISTQTTQGKLIGYGYRGGTGTASGDPIQPAGGGGGGQPGGDGIPTGGTAQVPIGSSRAGYGGDGIYNNFRTGTNIGYAGGGAGCSYASSEAVIIPTDKRAMFGGGWTGGDAYKNGVDNTGGGGGGAGFSFYTAAGGQGAGGSGIVVIRYLVRP